MSDAYVGEIRMFGGSYAPQNWHLCDGTLLSISQYPALFSLISTTYGGDARTTFGLPDLRGRVPVGQGQGTGLTARTLGQSGGASAVTVTQAQMPAHNHTFYAYNKPATSAVAQNGSGLAKPLTLPTGQVAAYAPAALVTATEQVALASNAITNSQNSGGAHANLMPYLAINYIICLNGLFPDLNS